MAGKPQHMAGKDTGCGFIGAIFGPKHRNKPPVPRLEASKEHQRQSQFPAGNHPSKRPPRPHNRPSKNPPPPPTAVKKPVTVKTKPVPSVNDHTTFKTPLYSVSQVTNITYTKQLRKEPSFTSSELSMRISVRRPSSGSSLYGATPNQIPGHLGNLVKKKVQDKDKRQSYGKLGNIYGNSPKKVDPEVFKNIGNEKYKQGRFDEAIKLYTEAIGIDSTVACYYSNRSAALIGLGKFVDAMLDCKIAIRINPSYHRAHYRLASLYLRFGDTEKALCHYKCSREKAERHDITKVQAVEAQLVTCSEAQRAKDWNRLLKESQFAYALGADSSIQVYAMQAEALLNLHRHDEAYSCFQNAPIIDVNTATRLFSSIITSDFLIVQAQVYLASGRFEEAVSVAMRASEIDQSEVASIVARKTRALAKARSNGNKLFKASQFYEACNAYSEGLEHEPYNAVLLCNRAACRYKLGQFERSVEDCTIALNLRPSYAKARLRRAQCNVKLERWEAAIQDYDVLNHETQGEEVEQEFLEARMQLEKQYVANSKPVKVVKNSNKDEFGGLLITV